MYFVSIHVINFKEASGRFYFHFLEVFEKCIEYIILHSFQGDFKILVKSDIFYKNFMAHFLESLG